MDHQTPAAKEPVATLLSAGRLVDVLQKLSLPVVAWPGRSIFRVRLHGHGFVLEVQGSTPCIGFYTTLFVAARTVRLAEAKAVSALQDRWETFYADAAGQLRIEVEEIERLHRRYMTRSRHGMVSIAPMKSLK